MLTAQDIYTAAQVLSLPERLRLAALLLDELASPSAPSVGLATLAGYSDFWTDEDIADFRQHCARHFSSTETFAEMDQDPALPPLEDLIKMQMEQSLEPEHL